MKFLNNTIIIKLFFFYLMLLSSVFLNSQTKLNSQQNKKIIFKKKSNKIEPNSDNFLNDPIFKYKLKYLPSQLESKIHSKIIASFILKMKLLKIINTQLKKILVETKTKDVKYKYLLYALYIISTKNNLIPYSEKWINDTLILYSKSQLDLKRFIYRLEYSNLQILNIEKLSNIILKANNIINEIEKLKLNYSNKLDINKKNNKFNNLVNSLLYYDYFIQANWAIWNNNIEYSLELLNKIILNNPKFIDAYFEKGNSLFNIEKYDSAIYYFINTLKKDNNYYDANLKLGISYFKKNIIDSSIFYYKKEINNNKNNLNAYSDLGYIYNDILKNYDSSIYYYGLILKKNDKYPNIKFHYNNALKAKSNKNLLIDSIQKH